MGFYVDLEMPKDCPMCPFAHYDRFDTFMGCDITRGKRWAVTNDKDYAESSTRPDWCPLIEVPEPHGRLIDADALHKLFEDQWHYLQVLDWNENPTAEAMQSGINWCINTMHDDAPTVIPASEEG
ncbi:MAG: hypothetical protein J6N19_09220 [Clostridium sp.]|nr:hypothetical protein [Clostridium sp.]